MKASPRSGELGGSWNTYTAWGSKRSDGTTGTTRTETTGDDNESLYTRWVTDSGANWARSQGSYLTPDEPNTHASVVEDAGGGDITFKEYHNGELTDKKTAADTLADLNGDVNLHSSDGHIRAEFLIYNRSLSASEIREYHNEGTVPDGSQTVWLKINEGSGTTLSDSSGNGNDGTLSGPGWVVDSNPFALEPSLLDVRVTDTFNRFARDATVVLDDPEGVLRADYPSGYPVQLEVKRDIDTSWSVRFGGFVFGDTTDRNTLELDILGHDLWLRRRKIFDSYTDTAISAILKDLIQTYTPLNWDASLVEVTDGRLYTRQWKGEALAEIIDELSAASDGEEFGATNDARFYFQPRETSQSPRSFGVGEYYKADFDEDTTREVNRVVLYYGEGSSTGAVAVQDRASQRALQNDLGAPRPVVIEKTANFPEIVNEATAETRARKILGAQTSIRTGKLRSWDAFDVTPGDIATVTAPAQNVDGEFRVAEIEYRWQADETRLRLAENSAGVVDVLSGLSDEVTRVDAKGADENASVNEVVDLLGEVVVETDIEVLTYSVPADQLLFGDWKGGFGDPDVGGGRLGDQRGDATKVV
jgi:hypothetical protein